MVSCIGTFHRRIKLLAGVLFLVLLLGNGQTLFADGTKLNKTDWDIKKQQKLLGKGINLGNALDAPTEGAWGTVLQEKYFAHVKKLGFQSVRIPIRWSAHVSRTAPYTIDSVFFKRVEWAVDQALKNKLRVVINVHHYEELMKDPQKEKPIFLAIWNQISERFSSAGPQLYFELCNEPNDQLTPALWNNFASEALAIIRKTNPYRSVIVGTGHWNSISGLPELKLPEDKYLMLTIHYYKPDVFTHQSASWVEGSDAWKGTKWNATQADTTILISHFNKVSNWAQKNNVPVYLGEFGAYDSADNVSRILYTSFVAKQANVRGWAYTYWKYNFNFGIYDDSTDKTHEDLLNAILKPSETFTSYIKKVVPELISIDTASHYVLVDDFEDTIPLQNCLAPLYCNQKSTANDPSLGFWFTWYNDSSIVTDHQGNRFYQIGNPEAVTKKNSLNIVGQWGKSGKGFHVKGVVKGNSYPGISLITNFTGEHDKKWFDFSKLTAISFWAKGSGAMRVGLTTDRVQNGYPAGANWGHFGADFGLTSNWKHYIIPVKDLKPKPWSPSQKDKLCWQDVMDKVCNLEISTSQAYDMVADDSIEIYIDDIRLYGLSYETFGLNNPK